MGSTFPGPERALRSSPIESLDAPKQPTDIPQTLVREEVADPAMQMTTELHCEYVVAESEPVAVAARFEEREVRLVVLPPKTRQLISTPPSVAVRVGAGMPGSASDATKAQRHSTFQCLMPVVRFSRNS